MSSLCPASSRILALRDEDLSELGVAPSSRSKKLLERRIDINLGCNFTLNGPGNSNRKFEVVAWDNGTTDLCGSCPFCNLLANSMQWSVESDLWDAWHLSSILDPTVLSLPLTLRANTHFEKLEYHRDTTQLVSAERNLGSMITGDLYLLHMTGYVLLYSKDNRDGGDLKRTEVDLVFELFGDEDDPMAKLLKIHRRPLHGSRLSDQNVSKMRDWIQDCDEHHEGCWADLKHLGNSTKAEARTFLPTRMIDVGDPLNGKHPRLVITSEIQPSVSKVEATKYMALSYCWGPVYGTNKQLKTTNSTIGSRMENIELEIMPQTFQDAVTVARTLRIQYLWIDSLCIIQDDARDWQIESSRMAEIFSNAYIALIAASGSGCNDGFLGRGLPDLSCTVPVKIASMVDVGGQFSLRFRRRLGNDKMSEIVAGRWITRGWTFQEERLARRVLMFGENKGFFDCRTLERAEDTNICRVRPDWVTSVTGVPEEGHGFNPENTEMGSHWNNWQTLCTQYTYRELTFPEDKLPAISGIAHKIGKKAQSEYLAGLWRNNLLHDLFWQTNAVATKPQNYRAPSWSWASLDGRLYWPSSQIFSTCSKCTEYCTVLDAQTTPVGLDPYGAVKDGFLKVHGILEEIGVVWVGGHRSHHPWRLHHEGEEIGNVNLDIESDDMRRDGHENIYQALPVAKCQSWEKKETLIRGLLLERKGRERGSHNEYGRVGTFTLFSSVLPVRNGSFSVFGSNAEQTIMIV